MRYSASFCSAVCSTCAVCARIAAVLLAMSRCCASSASRLVALDRQRGLARDQVLLRDVDLGGADDLVALLLALPGDLGQRRQAVGVEEIARVEMLDVALVEPRQRHRFELEAVVLDVGADRVLHRLDEGRTLLLQLFEVHGGGDRTQAVDEFRLDQLAQFAGIVGAAAQRLRGERDRRRVGFDAHDRIRRRCRRACGPW